MARERKVSITGLTLTQYSILCDILNATKDCMEWDEGMQEYTDGGNFIYSMTKEEYEQMQNIKM